MFDWKKLFNGKPEITHAEAIELFKADPAKWFTSRGEPYLWPLPKPEEVWAVSLNNMSVCVEGFTLGYVESSSYLKKTATIGHIATSEDFAGQGIGPLIARVYAKELGTRFAVDRIIFAEYSSKYQKFDYPGFFSKIGATPLPHDPRNEKADRPDYEWLKASW